MDGPQYIFDYIYSWLSHFATNFHRNLFHMFDDMNATRYIRLVACVGAYFLVRPYFVKVGERIQAAEYEKISKSEAKDEWGATNGTEGKLEPNALRDGKRVVASEKSGKSVKGGKNVSFAKENGEEEEEDEGWGKKARLRQRKVEEAKEKASRGEDLEEGDILELLEDYEPGKDGW